LGPVVTPITEVNKLITINKKKIEGNKENNFNDLNEILNKKINKISKLADNNIKFQEKEIKEIIQTWKRLKERTNQIKNQIEIETRYNNTINNKNFIKHAHMIENEIKERNIEIRNLNKRTTKIMKYIEKFNNKTNEEFFISGNKRKAINEVRVESKGKINNLNTNKLISNEVNIGNNLYSDSIIELDKDLTVEIKNFKFKLSNFIKYKNMIIDLFDRCGRRLEKCIITKAEETKNKEKNNSN